MAMNDAGGIVGRIDRDERKRLIMQAAEARRNSPHLRVGSPRNSDSGPAAIPRNKRAKAVMFLSGHLGYTNSLALGDMIRRKLVNRALSEAMRAEAVEHVKDGKPLTAHGARLLGVPWPAE